MAGGAVVVMYKGFVFIVIILLSACAEGRKSDAELKAAVHAYVQTDALVNWHTAADADSEHADVGDQPQLPCARTMGI